MRSMLLLCSFLLVAMTTVNAFDQAHGHDAVPRLGHQRRGMEATHGDSPLSRRHLDGKRMILIPRNSSGTDKTAAPSKSNSSGKQCQVQSGGSDDTSNILSAFSQCNNGGTVVFSKGATYRVGSQLTFKGLQNVHVDVQGTIQLGLGNAGNLGGGHPTCMMNFEQGSNIQITGSGTIDGNGSKYYGKSNGPCMISFIHVQGLLVDGLSFTNSPGYYLYGLGVHDGHFNRLKISTDPKQRPANTDGIMLSTCTGITITDTVINTFDDCIAIKSGVEDVVVQNVYCNNGHGFSVGSIKDGTVQNVKFINVVCENCMSAARIKTSLDGSSGLVKNILFDGVISKGSRLPINIDQIYPSKSLANKGKSNVVLEGIKFNNFKGTPWPNAQNAGLIICSAGQTCKDISFSGIQLGLPFGCVNFDGEGSGIDCQPIKALPNGSF